MTTALQKTSLQSKTTHNKIVEKGDDQPMYPFSFFLLLPYFFKKKKGRRRNFDNLTFNSFFISFQNQLEEIDYWKSKAQQNEQDLQDLEETFTDFQQSR
jgi:hypothetical protein